ncbi:MAG: hypothetical protein IPO81_21455 [Kouleothrix sp.]|nr:hypothetical protein [Kouleothrix sp.]
MDNQGTLTINGLSANFNTIDNAGQPWIINAEPSNYGTINNTGTIQITCVIADRFWNCHGGQSPRDLWQRQTSTSTSNAGRKRRPQHADGNADEPVPTNTPGRIRPYYPPTR